MRKLLTTLVVLANLLFPVRFGLAELSGFDSHSYGRRTELVKRIKQAGLFSELYAKKTAARFTGSDKKPIRRPLYTKNDTALWSDSALLNFFDIRVRGKFAQHDITFYRIAPFSALLRAPPSVL